MIQQSVASGIFRHYLGGFKDYPLKRDARHIEVFAECSISVEHAQAIADSFADRMPTLKELRDVAFQLREKFDPSPPLKEQWEKQYGKPDPDWSRNLVGSYKQQLQKVLWQSIRDSVFYTEGRGRFDLTQILDSRQRATSIQFWSDAMAGHCKNHPVELAAFRAELAERGWEVVMASDWVKEAPAIPPPKMTEDRRREIEVQFEVLEREPGDGE